MTIRHLRTLIAIHDLGSFKAAAEATFVTHAAVSQQMKSLEQQWGVQLFRKSARARQLTPVAIDIVNRGREVVASYDSLNPSKDGSARGSLVIGAIPTSLTGIVPAALHFMKKFNPEVRVNIIPGLTNELLKLIDQRALDAAIVTRITTHASAHLWDHIATERMELLTSRRVVSDDPKEILKSNPYIRYSRQAVVGNLIDKWLLDQGVAVSESMELGSLDAIQSMVASDLGVSIVPRQIVQPVIDLPLRRLRLDPDTCFRELCLVSKRDNPRAGLVSCLYEMLMLSTEENLRDSHLQIVI